MADNTCPACDAVTLAAPIDAMILGVFVRDALGSRELVKERFCSTHRQQYVSAMLRVATLVEGAR